jgi:predicted nucleic acid binding AN1-type Zn finger protein
MNTQNNIVKNKTNKTNNIENSDIQININRCMSCNKKIGLLGIQCKCKYYFCTEHRYSDHHNCTFDYKTCSKELLKKANPIVIHSKINTI